MKNNKLIPGVVLVLIGAAILLANFHVLNFQWWNILRLWPIFLVIAGVNLVFAHNQSTWATILKIAVIVIGFGLLFFGNFEGRYNFWPGFHYSYEGNHNDFDDNDNNNNNDDEGVVSPETNGSFSEPFSAGTKVARLELSGGGTTFTLNDTTSQLFSAVVNDRDGRYILSHRKDDDSVEVINFHMKNHKGLNFDSDKNAATMKLNTNPVWDINVNAGATELNFDLSKFKVKQLDVKGGAASFNFKLGQPLTETHVEISTGVSGVDIAIPRDAACSVESNSGLSDTHFEGFNKVDNNTYESAGFDTAKNKMYIHISGGLSDFKVTRY